MIHAKELRFGNKVQHHSGEVITVQQILCSTLVYDTQLNVSREDTPVKGSYGTGYATQFVEMIREADFHEVHPIVLTPLILKKCGFRNFVREEWIFSVGNTHFDFEWGMDGLRLRHMATHSRGSIRYLHQLQNLLFLIAGYELDAAFLE